MQAASVNLGVLAIMKNEAMNIREWLDHYFWIGADRIFLIDNGSTDDSVALARAHPRSRDIEIIELPEPHQQNRHYWTALKSLGVRAKVDWLMMADLDEFWFLKAGRDIKRVFGQYQHVDLIYTNWAVFGSGGFDRHPESLRRDLIIRRPKLAAHENSKWIVRTAALKADEVVYNHKVRDIDSRRVISDNVELQLNHYVTQSREYFEAVKMTRGDVSKMESDAVRDWAYFDRYDAACSVEDTLLRDLIAANSTKEHP